MMIGKLAFKAATHNIAIINAFFKDLNPILKYIFGKKVRESPGFTKLFTVEDLLECIQKECIQKECNPDTSENSEVFLNNNENYENFSYF